VERRSAHCRRVSEDPADHAEPRRLACVRSRRLGLGRSACG